MSVDLLCHFSVFVCLYLLLLLFRLGLLVVNLSSYLLDMSFNISVRYDRANLVLMEETVNLANPVNR